MKLCLVQPILPGMKATTGPNENDGHPGYDMCWPGSWWTQRTWSAAAASPLVIPKPCPTSATTGLPNSLLQMKPALMHSFLIRIEKWGFTTLRWGLWQQMWPQTCPTTINPPNIWKCGAVHKVILCLVRRHYPAELDLPGACADVWLLTSLPRPLCDEMIACKTTGSYSPSKSLGIY